MGKVTRGLGRTLRTLAALTTLVACGDEAPIGATESTIRGRVTDVNGAPLADVEVVAAGRSVRTSASGRFELRAEADRELRLAVKSDLYTAAELPVVALAELGANVEVAVKPRRVLKLSSAASGGRVEGDDGFALELPADALRDDAGNAVQGEVEVRYAVINAARDVTAAPGRLQSRDGKGMDGYGMAEVSFYQAGRRVRLSRAMNVEVPLDSGHGLREGQEVDAYGLADQDVRWQPASARARVRGQRLVLSASHDSWVGAARALTDTSCAKGRLTAGNRQIANTTIRAARERGLSMVQAESQEDGSFCLPISPDDDWQVSVFHDDGQNAVRNAVKVRSDQAVGMCGGTGCKELGELPLATAQ